eukprot:tig00000145_g8812.t1
MLYVKQRAAARKGQRDGRPRTGLLDLPDAVLALILRLAAKPAPSGRGPADSTAEESFDECACASLFDEERYIYQEAARTALLERVCRRFRRALREPCTIERISLNCGKKDKDGRPAALACFSGRAPDWAALRAVELREIPAGPGPAATAEAVAAALALCPALEELRVELEWCAGPPPAALEAVLAALPAMPGLRRLELALSEGCLAAAPADLLRIAALPASNPSASAAYPSRTSSSPPSPPPAGVPSAPSTPPSWYPPAASPVPSSPPSPPSRSSSA